MNTTNANLIYIYISLVDNGHSDANITNDVFEHRISVFLFFVILSVYALLFIHQQQKKKIHLKIINIKIFIFL